MWVEHEMASIFSSQAYMATGTAPFNCILTKHKGRWDGCLSGEQGDHTFWKGLIHTKKKT